KVHRNGGRKLRKLGGKTGIGPCIRFYFRDYGKPEFPALRCAISEPRRGEGSKSVLNRCCGFVDAALRSFGMEDEQMPEGRVGERFAERRLFLEEPGVLWIDD